MTERTDAPLLVEGAEHFVERNYREGGRYQWVRETLVNAIESGATRVQFGTEWQAVEMEGVYRRTIADNGTGMTPDQLLAFFRTYGGSGKAIGGIHENFGIGAKCSLFPWNKLGVVIVSWHEDYEEPSMIWVRKSPTTGAYGLRTWETSGGGENVIAAGLDDETGIDWSAVKPDFIDDHGTVIILLGDEPSQDTVLGDPFRDEGGTPGVGIVNYLNRRMWSLGDVEVTVDEYRGDDPKKWPRNSSTTYKGKLQRGTRSIDGARSYIFYDPSGDKGGITAEDTVVLSDGTQIDWYLWEGDGRSGIRSAAMNGYICAQYAPGDARTFPELFDVTDHASRFRAFGISETDVRRRLWLVVKPPLAEDHSFGVYMSSDRNRLLVQGGPRAGDPLPWEEWAAEFAERMPEALVEAINAARAGSADSQLDATWRERLAERFGRRWRQVRLVTDPKGDKTTNATDSGGSTGTHHRPKKKTGGSTGGTGGTTGDKTVGTTEGGDTKAKERKVAVGVPEVRWESDASLFDPGMFGVWNPASAANPSGLVQLNVEHPILREEILFWAPQYPTHLEDEVIDVIKTTYAQLAAAAVAHSESLRVHLERAEDLEKLRSQAAITASLLGLMGANAVIGPMLGGALGSRRKAAQASA